MIFRSLRRVLFVVVFFAASGWSQSQSQPSSVSPTSTQRTGGAAAQKAPDQPAVEKKISPQETEELFRDVDEILHFASSDTSLPIKQTVKRRMVDRDEVVAYLKKNMAEDKDTQRLQRSELVLKKFGLLPPDFDLQTFLVNLLREQVAGYYDPKTQTVNLLDWVDIDQQRPVLAHELTHALQDQSFGVEKFMKSMDVDLDEKPQLTWDDFLNDEASDTRQAVVEGQAMAVLMDYILAPTGKTLLNSQDLVDALKAGMLVGTPDQVEFQHAPLYLKEALTFPYRYGLDFTIALLRNGGNERAYVQPFKNPPRTSREVMEPETYLAGENLPPMPIPDFDRDFKGYTRFDLGAMGELDVSALLDVYVGEAVSKSIYPAWRGGYYYAARSKQNAAGPLALTYVSRWSDSSHATQFADLYAKSFAQRYHHLRKEEEKPRDAGVRRQRWHSDEGEMEVEVRDDTVFISESLDPSTRTAVENDLWPPPAPAK